jgi:hypothetical protein
MLRGYRDRHPGIRGEPAWPPRSCVSGRDLCHVLRNHARPVVELLSRCPVGERQRHGSDLSAEAAHHARSGRSVHRPARCLGGRRRRPHLLSAVHRQRRLPAHRDGAALDSGAGAARWLQAAARRRVERLPCLHREQRLQGRHSAARAARASPARARHRSSSRLRTNWRRAIRGTI